MNDLNIKLKRAREILGDDVGNLSDKELTDFIFRIQELVSIGFDCYEKNKFGKVISIDKH